MNNESLPSAKLFELVSQLLGGSMDFETFEKQYTDLLIDASPGSLALDERQFLWNLLERMSFVSLSKWPTDEELSDGIISQRDFINWLKEQPMAQRRRELP